GQHSLPLNYRFRTLFHIAARALPFLAYGGPSLRRKPGGNRAGTFCRMVVRNQQPSSGRERPGLPHRQSSQKANHYWASSFPARNRFLISRYSDKSSTLPPPHSVLYSTKPHSQSFQRTVSQLTLQDSFALQRLAAS